MFSTVDAAGNTLGEFSVLRNDDGSWRVATLSVGLPRALCNALEERLYAQFRVQGDEAMKTWAPFVALSLLIPACALVPTPAPSEELPLHPATPPPEAMLESLGDILILRAYSGPFVSHEERILLAAPDLVVFDDGLVVADTRPFVSEPPEFRSIQLTPDEQDELMEQLVAAELSPLAAGGPVGGTFCFDCPTTIIRTDIGGETIEIAAFGLLTDVTERYVSALPYPPGLIAVDRLLDGLVDRVRAAESDPFDRSLPEVPVLGMGGG